MWCSTSRATSSGGCGCCAASRTASGPPIRSACSRWAMPACSRWPTRRGGWWPASTARCSGSVVFPSVDGRRPLLVEVQALVSPKVVASPRRSVRGLEAARVHQVLAVLERHADFDLSDRDVYVSVVGGLQVRDPGADLPVAIALVSSYLDKALGPTAAWGEVGLTGEVRAVAYGDRRAAEAARLGVKVAVGPTGNGEDRIDRALQRAGLPRPRQGPAAGALGCPVRARRSSLARNDQARRRPRRPSLTGPRHPAAAGRGADLEPGLRGAHRPRLRARHRGHLQRRVPSRRGRLQPGPAGRAGQDGRGGHHRRGRRDDPPGQRAPHPRSRPSPPPRPVPGIAPPSGWRCRRGVPRWWSARGGPWSPSTPGGASTSCAAPPSCWSRPTRTC